MKRPLKLVKGQSRVSLNLKHEVIMEPALAAGDVLWSLISTRREERVIRTMGRNMPGGVGQGVPGELSRASQQEGADRDRPVYPRRGTCGRDSNPASVTDELCDLG